MKAFPIPLVALGPGSQEEDETLQYMPMPQGMGTYRAPALPEADAMRRHGAARQALRDVLARLGEVSRGAAPCCVNLAHLSLSDRELVNQVLGEGEVSAIVEPAPEGARTGGADACRWQVQESVFAGVWRVIGTQGDTVMVDTIELGPVPQVLRDAAHADAEDHAGTRLRAPGALPPGVQNAPSLLAEIEDHSAAWRPGEPARVVNLTLLPMSPADIAYLDHHLGTGRVLILSRGYGNCRITNTRLRGGWRVVYYNSQDAVILNTVEVSALPEVALAAPEDLEDSHERLAEVLAWIEA